MQLRASNPVPPRAYVIARGGFQKPAAKAKAKAKRPKRPSPPPRSQRALQADGAPNQRAAQADELRERHLATVNEAVLHYAPSMASGLAQHGFAVVDDFLPPESIAAMRAEAVGLKLGGRMVPSESTRWNEAAGRVETYRKENVMSYNVVGGPEYEHAPRLTEWCVALVSTLPGLINERFPEVALSSTVHTNKLAVCCGEGSHYAKHYDNSGADDLRKLTVLLYLQQEWKAEHGGCFRMYTGAESGDESRSGEVGVEDGHAFVDVSPVGGRLLAFWSDTMVHGVQPSFTPDEQSDRWALTCWLHTDEHAAIRFDPEVEARHFGEHGAEHRQLAG